MRVLSFLDVCVSAVALLDTASFEYTPWLVHFCDFSLAGLLQMHLGEESIDSTNNPKASKHELRHWLDVVLTLAFKRSSIIGVDLQIARSTKFMLAPWTPWVSVVTLNFSFKRHGRSGNTWAGNVKGFACSD